jgi:hypothetical protein
MLISHSKIMPYPTMIVTAILVATAPLIWALATWQSLWDLIIQNPALATGLMALSAAVPTVIFLIGQLIQTEMHRREERNSKFRATRAIMDLALSDLCDYARSSANHANQRLYILNKGLVPDIPLPKYSRSIINTLRDIIEYGPEDVGASIQDLISIIQTHHSRLRGLPRRRGEIGDKSAFDDAIWDAAELYAYASGYFNYARLRSDKLPNQPDLKEVENAIRTINPEFLTRPGLAYRFDTTTNAPHDPAPDSGTTPNNPP